MNVMERVAITIWRGRVSPVFESAGRILAVDMESGRELSRREYDLPVFISGRGAGGGLGVDRAVIFRKVDRLKEIGAGTLICGAVSDRVGRLLNSSGIEVIGWISGDAEEVVSACIDGSINDPVFLMPGCCGGAGRRRRQRRGRSRTPGGGRAEGRGRGSPGFAQQPPDRERD